MSAFNLSILGFLICAGLSADWSEVDAQMRRTMTVEERLQGEAHCASIASQVRSARADQTGINALRSLANCPEAGPDLIAERIAGRPSDTTYVKELRESSRYLNDKRIANAALAVIEDEGAPLSYRYRALEIIATQLSPTLSTTVYRKAIPLLDFKDPSKVIGTTTMASGSVGFQPTFVEGREPVDVATRGILERALLRAADRANNKDFAEDIRGIVARAADWRGKYPPK